MDFKTITKLVFNNKIIMVFEVAHIVLIKSSHSDGRLPILTQSDYINPKIYRLITTFSLTIDLLKGSMKCWKERSENELIYKAIPKYQHYDYLN